MRKGLHPLPPLGAFVLNEWPLRLVFLGQVKYILKCSVNHRNHRCEKLCDRSERWIYPIYMTKDIRSLFCSDCFKRPRVSNEHVVSTLLTNCCKRKSIPSPLTFSITSTCFQPIRFTQYWPVWWDSFNYLSFCKYQLRKKLIESKVWLRIEVENVARLPVIRIVG